MWVLADHGWWHTVGEWVVWAGAVAAAVGVMAITPIGKGVGRLVKWVWRQLVSRPVTDWGTRVVGQVVEDKLAYEFRNNEGKSMRDAVDAIRAGQTVTNQHLARHDRRFVQVGDALGLEWSDENEFDSPDGG